MPHMTPCSRGHTSGRYADGGCIECARASSKRRHAAGLKKPAAYDPEDRRERNLRANYGLTIAAYEQMLKAQNSVCAICQGDNEKEHFSVDHDHLTGNVRALLCGNCNRGLGSFQDRPELTEKATAYLREHGRI